MSSGGFSSIIRCLNKLRDTEKLAYLAHYNLKVTQTHMVINSKLKVHSDVNTLEPLHQHMFKKQRFREIFFQIVKHAETS